MNTKYFVITVVGSHAGEDLATIFSRKQKELIDRGKTYWLLKSFKAKTQQIQEFCRKAVQANGDIYVLFIDSSSKHGARPTVHNDPVQHISSNGIVWEQLPRGVNITGKIDSQSSVIVLDKLELMNPDTDIDLWDFSEFETDKPVKLQLGASTICCVRKVSKGMKSRYRKTIAWGRLVYPYSVLVK